MPNNIGANPAFVPSGPSHSSVSRPVGFNPGEWEKTSEALDLLCRIDAFERSSDRYYGLGWSEPAKAFRDMANEARDELEYLRDEAVKAAASGHPKFSDEWFDAMDEADDRQTSLDEAIQRARRLRFGDGLLEQGENA